MAGVFVSTIYLISNTSLKEYLCANNTLTSYVLRLTVDFLRLLAVHQFNSSDCNRHEIELVECVWWCVPFVIENLLHQNMHSMFDVRCIDVESLTSWVVVVSENWWKCWQYKLGNYSVSIALKNLLSLYPNDGIIMRYKSTNDNNSSSLGIGFGNAMLHRVSVKRMPPKRYLHYKLNGFHLK